MLEWGFLMRSSKPRRHCLWYPSNFRGRMGSIKTLYTLYLDDCECFLEPNPISEKNLSFEMLRRLSTQLRNRCAHGAYHYGITMAKGQWSCGSTSRAQLSLAIWWNQEPPSVPTSRCWASPGRWLWPERNVGHRSSTTYRYTSIYARICKNMCIIMDSA